MKRFSIALLILVLILSIGVQAFADSFGNNNDEFPIKGIAPNNGYPEEPGGTLKPGEGKTRVFHKGELNSKRSDGVTINHFSLTPHVHHFDRITAQYDGYIDRGEVASGYNGKSSKDTLDFSITRTVSNTWSTNIGFSADVVSGGVGFDVTWSEQKSWGYSVEVNPYKTAHIGYQDWYHIKDFTCYTRYFLSTPLILILNLVQVLLSNGLNRIFIVGKLN
ncbi:hypothetical protein [Caloranaerobacter azorensis]|uniref:Uncharacterized protein n=1 Tax=Caloranaerobacter azorensis TaxID=116090 RepID=A0A6P1YA86_9FIRM|nr:hypothetical protein [Caloranaerobacter azorensis]QIB25937.1 hypothetical protein G3A45_00565 [Caloranaerobacter azorensis]